VGKSKKKISAHNGNSVHDCIEIRFRLCKAKMQRDVEWNDESYSENSTWGNSRRRRSSISRLTPPISLMERRQRNEQFFFPRPINIFVTILLPRLPPPPALPLFSSLSSFFSPYRDMSNPVETMRNDGRQVSSFEYTDVSISDDENALCRFSVHSLKATAEKL